MDNNEYLNTTLGELLEMRSTLNAALKEKIGREADSYFNIEMNSYHDDRISFCLAYPTFSWGAVVSSQESFETPKAAFDFAMNRIAKCKAPTKQDRINELKKKIEEIENEN